VLSFVKEIITGIFQDLLRDLVLAAFDRKGSRKRKRQTGSATAWPPMSRTSTRSGNRKRDQKRSRR
jgi:hypothetical protein